jgi:DNA adenine methylase
MNKKDIMEVLKPILKYPGSKATIAPWIISQFPAHTRYVEPYCGSAAVLMQKERSTHEVLNDLSSDVVNLFRVIRERGDELSMAIEMTPWSEEEYQRSTVSSTEGDELEQARRFLVRSWQAYGATLSHVTGWRHSGSKGNAHPAKLWTKLPDRILAVVDRLRGVEIRNRTALEIIGYYNDPECLLFVDPPYPLSTRSRKYYLHEMTDSEHVELLELLDKHAGSVVLSGYACKLYDEKLKHWNRITMNTSGERGKQHTEVLWMNFEPVQQRQLSLFGKGA